MSIDVYLGNYYRTFRINEVSIIISECSDKIDETRNIWFENVYQTQMCEVVCAISAS